MIFKNPAQSVSSESFPLIPNSRSMKSESTIVFLLLLFLLLATVALTAPTSGDEIIGEMAIIVREELC